MKSRILSLFGLVVLVSCLSVQAAERPNVVIFLVDDMGWMDSTPYGSQYYETPNMQRLAKQSMRFTDAYALPLCSPTRASILTGQYSSRHRVTSASGHQPAAATDASPYPSSAPATKPLIYANSKNYLDPSLTTLAEVLQQANYRTGHFGKWHLGLSQEHWPDKQGFDVAFHAQPSPGPPSYFSPYAVSPDGKPSGQHHVGTITDGPEGEYITDRLTDEAIRFIEASKDQPFYLNFWHYGVHGPWGHKEEYTREFAKKSDPRGEQRNPIMASMLKSVDESLGRVLDKLDELKLTDNTLFIFYSDNGGNTHSNTPDSREMQNIKPGHKKWDFVQDWKKWAGPEAPTNNAPLREGKGRIYEGGQRVPMMVRWPEQIKANSTTGAVVGPIDLFPTVLDAVGIESPPSHIVDGESLLPVLTQSGQLKRKAYFTWFPHLVPAVSVRQGDWKLIHRFEPHVSYPELLELYNLKDDIGETVNLANEHPEKVQELESLIVEFMASTGALAPKLNPAYRETPAKDNTTGLVARLCELHQEEGHLRITGTGAAPFLGTAQMKLSGDVTLKMVVRSTAGGEGRVHWKTPAQDNFPKDEQLVKFQIPAGEDWQTVTVSLSIPEQPQVVRLYLPVQDHPLDVRSIEYSDKGGRKRAWDFTAR
ncbi:MAG: sulfatase [Planctomycetaceae bacterium]|nr:sulfatase [Planctomycetaceae bacterium]